MLEISNTSFMSLLDVALVDAKLMELEPVLLLLLLLLLLLPVSGKLVLVEGTAMLTWGPGTAWCR